MKRALSLAALTVLELSPVGRVQCAAAAGYSHVSLRLIAATPEEGQHDVAGDPVLRRQLRRALVDTGLQVLDVEILRLEPATDIAAFEPTLACAQELGARHLLVAGNDPDRGRLVDRFGTLCDHAASHGLTADLEFMPWTDVPDLASALQVLRQVDHGNAGVLVDAFHFSRSGGHLDQLAAVPRGWLHFMQLCDVPAALPSTLDAVRTEARTARRFPGEGELNLAALLRALPDDLAISLEVPMVALAREVSALDRARRALEGTRRLLGADRRWAPGHSTGRKA